MTYQELGSLDFWQIANSVFNKSKFALPSLFNDLKILSSVSDKGKLFAKTFSKSSNLDDSGISLPVVLPGANLKLHNVSVTSKMFMKLIMNLDSSKVSVPDCIIIVVLKNCDPELSYIITLQ